VVDELGAAEALQAFLPETSCWKSRVPVRTSPQLVKEGKARGYFILDIVSLYTYRCFACWCLDEEKM